MITYVDRAPAAVAGPAWDISGEYASLSCVEYKADMASLEKAIGEIDAMGRKIGGRVDDAAGLDPSRDSAFLADLRRFALAQESARILLANLATYASCVLSTDGSDAEAAAARGYIGGLDASLDAAIAPWSLVLVLAPSAFFEAFCASGETKRFRFTLSQARKDRDRALPLAAERAISSMSADGYHAWGNLYISLAGTVRCRIIQADGSEEAMGLAKAAGLLKRPERDTREAAWRGINGAMSEHEQSFAAILNSISGWRRSEAELRSHTEKVQYLDMALRQSRLSKATLDAMMGVIRDSKELGRRALRAQASLYGVDRLGPWDILAPAPASVGKATAVPFEDGLATVRRAYAAIHPSMGEFVDSMARSGRIEGRVKDGKRPGAYCTEFLKSRDSYVYTSYQGSLSDLSTLAHELGHAYHSAVMRDISFSESDYPMTLAETASTFAETALGEMLSREAKDETALLDLAWADAQDAVTFLVNIPARFEFEASFYERRPSGPLGPDCLKALMRDAWAQWYGDSLSSYDDMYWASKLHFYKTGRAFYNFPYSFGYLFSLGVYARREALGDGFHDAYVALLRDTGRMEVEELAAKHLGVDLTQPGFWRSSVAIVEAKVTRFEELAAKMNRK